MQTLFEFEHDGRHFVVSWLPGDDESLAAQVIVTIDGVIAAEEEARSGRYLLADSGAGHLELEFAIDHDKNLIAYALHNASGVVLSATAPLPVASAPAPANRPRNTGRLFAIGGAAFKVFKSAGAVKVALAGSAFAGWSFLLDWRFAAMLIAIIVFHEYGHVTAMKRWGIPTKGIYLIPFFGGVAVGDKARTYWQEVYISMMGPVFGLIMTVAALAGYYVTGLDLLGVVASYAALINVLNLLPIYPLDGGHVIRAITFSASPRWSTAVLIALSAGGFALASAAGLYLISFFLVIGALDLMGSRQALAARATVPMDRYGMTVSVLWYVAVVAVFAFIIVNMAAQGVPGAEVPFVLLSD